VLYAMVVIGRRNLSTVLTLLRGKHLWSADPVCGVVISVQKTWPNGCRTFGDGRTWKVDVMRVRCIEGAETASKGKACPRADVPAKIIG
jgi:hypothetical protein